jgi:catechol 2,3-dioxygenase-like lactoylglutathione lyase family enzyme
MNLNEIAYFTKNVQEMVSFYRALMGREPVAESPDMAIFLNGETKIFIHATYTPGAGELPPENHIAFTVVDVDQACRTLAAQGLVIEIEPHDYYWGRSAYLRDPDGHLIELIAQGES